MIIQQKQELTEENLTVRLSILGEEGSTRSSKDGLKRIGPLRGNNMVEMSYAGFCLFIVACWMVGFVTGLLAKR